MRNSFLLRAALIFALVCGCAAAQAQKAPYSSRVLVLDRTSGYQALPDGMIINDGAAREEITAVRDNVVRVRIAPNGVMPENASWAVLPEELHSHYPVTPDSTAAYYGFRTSALEVRVDRATMRLTVLNSAGDVIQQDALPVRFEGKSYRVYKAMPINEHFFALGGKTGPVDRRNEAFTMWNTDHFGFQESTDPIYRSIPFVLIYRAGVASGVFLDDTWRSSFDFGKALPGVWSFGAVAGPLNYYILYGPSPKKVVETYAKLTGTPKLPPLWSLGYQQSRWTYTPESRVLQVAARLRKDKIPADVIYLDIGYQYKNRPFTVDKKTFPTFAKMIAELHAEHFHVVAITDPHIAKVPDQGYYPYDSGVAGDDFVHNPNGSLYTGVVWPGPSVFPDFTQKKTRVWWGTLYKHFHDIGVDGFWNDMDEPSIFDTPTKTMPLNVLFRIDTPGFKTRTATSAEVHNIYGLETSRATYEGQLRLAPNVRPFVLTRATYAGGQRYATTWTGDDSSTWNQLRMTTPMLENLGLSGFAFAGADVGGFAGAPPMDLLTKWMEVAAFQPFDRDHTEKGSPNQEPWVGGPAQEAIRRKFIDTRYRLMPYLYTLADEASRTGLPLERPLFLEYPDAAKDKHPLDIDLPASGEFLVGRDLLVAPEPFSEEPAPYTVELPSPVWYSFWTGRKYAATAEYLRDRGPSAAPLTVEETPALAKLPVFVHAGSILPMEPLVQSTNITPQGPLTLRVYVGKDCSGSLYDDDGRTFDYEHGVYLRRHYTCVVSPTGFTLSADAQQGIYPGWWKDIRVEVYGWKPSAASATLNGQPLHAKIMPIPNGLTVTIPVSTRSWVLSME